MSEMSISGNIRIYEVSFISGAVQEGDTDVVMFDQWLDSAGDTRTLIVCTAFSTILWFIECEAAD